MTATYIKDNSRFSVYDLRVIYPTMSIPEDAGMTEYGYAKLVLTAQPTALPGFSVIEGSVVDSTQTWVQIPYDRNSKVLEVKALRDQYSDEGGYKIMVDGVAKWFHSDPKSRIQQLALMMLGANLPAVPWKTMDQSFVTMTQHLANSIFQAAVMQDTLIFANAEAHISAIADCEDPANYDFSTGWPAVYAP